MHSLRFLCTWICLLAAVALLAPAGVRANDDDDESLSTGTSVADKVRDLQKLANYLNGLSRDYEVKAEDPNHPIKLRNRRLAKATRECATLCWKQADALQKGKMDIYKEAARSYNWWHEEMIYLSEGREPVHKDWVGPAPGSTTTATTTTPESKPWPGMPTGGVTGGVAAPTVSVGASPAVSSNTPKDTEFVALEAQANELKRRLAEPDADRK